MTTNKQNESRLPVDHVLAAALAAGDRVTVLSCDLFADGSGLSVLLEHFGRRVACSLTGLTVISPCVGTNDRRPAWQWSSSTKAAGRVFDAMVAALSDSERAAIAATYANAASVCAGGC
jgi:hypothetical protein